MYDGFPAFGNECARPGTSVFNRRSACASFSVWRKNQIGWSRKWRPDQRISLSRRATAHWRFAGTKKSGRHDDCRFARRRPREKRLGAPASRITRNSIRKYPSQRMGASQQRAGCAVLVVVSKQSPRKDFCALPVRRRPHRSFRRNLPDGLRRLDGPAGNGRNVLFWF